MDEQENASNNKISENLLAEECDEEDIEETENMDTNQIASNEQQMAKVNEAVNDQQMLPQEDQQLSDIEQALHNAEQQALPQQQLINEMQMNDVIDNGVENENEEEVDVNGDEDEDEEAMIRALANANQLLIRFDDQPRIRPQLLPNWLPIRYEEKFKVDEDKDQEIVEEYKPSDDYVDVLRFGLKRFNESKALKRLDDMIVAESESESESVGNQVNCDEFNVLSDQVLSHLFQLFTFQGRVVLSMVCPQWREQMSEVFVEQSYVWFSKKYDSMPRFLPIVDCCDSCHQIINEENCILFANSHIDTIVNSLLVFTPNLKCLRITRFVMNSSKLIRDLGYLCPKLIHIDLSECSLFTKSVAHEMVTQFPNLRHLILANTGIDDQFLEVIVTGLKKLVTLVVNCNRITGEYLSQITDTIETLDTHNCIDFNSNTFQTFNSEVKHKKLIHLKANTGLDRQSFATICLTFESLVSLELNNPWNNSDISDIDCSEITQLSNLQSLKIGNGIQLSNSSLIHIMKACNHIKSFCYVSQHNITCKISDTVFAQISDHWPHLQRLELISVSTIGKKSIKSISKLNDLYYFNLSSCVNIEDSYVSKFLSSNDSIDLLILDRCERISHQTLESVIIKAFKMNERILRVSMIRCDLKNIQYMRTSYMPNNLRLTFSSAFARKFCTFDGKRISFGRFNKLYHFMNDYESVKYCSYH